MDVESGIEMVNRRPQQFVDVEGNAAHYDSKPLILDTGDGRIHAVDSAAPATALCGQNEHRVLPTGDPWREEHAAHLHRCPRCL